MNYNYQEFLAFVLLYAAHVDIEYSIEEEEKIKALVSNKSYANIYDDFNNMSDYAALQRIINYKGLYYPTTERKEELLSKIKELFYSDGDFSKMEKELLVFLNKML